MRNSCLSCVCTLAIVLASTLPARATVAPDVKIDVEINGLPTFSTVPPVTGQTGANRFHYVGSHETNADWTLTWEITAEADPFLRTEIGIENTSDETLDFDILVTIPLENAMPAPTLVGGSASGSMTADGDGGTITLIQVEDAMYTGYLDANQINQLLTSGDPFTVGAFESATIGPDAFGTPIPSDVGPGVDDEISIRWRFKLTKGETVGFNGVLVVTPEPSSLLLFGGAAGAVLLRRRRRA